MIQVAFISRATLYTSPGGDTRQMEKTASSLREMGVSVDIYLADQDIDYKKYNILHFFNIIRPADILKHIEISKKPYVVSTIFVEYAGTHNGATSFTGALRNVLSAGMIEYVKVIGRALKNAEKIVSKRYLLLGHTKSVKYVAKFAGCLLPNSESEFARLAGKFDISCDHIVVPNGIDEELVNKGYPTNDEYKDTVICMGRIEPRKNQLGLIRALNGTNYRVFIHGSPSPNQKAYYRQCLHEASGNISIREWLPDSALYAVYRSARVHVLPSYFETTGLSSLEAAVMGCNVVITDRGDTRDYFGDNASYCDPDHLSSIKSAVDSAFLRPYDVSFRAHILNNYTWKLAAEKTLLAYKRVLKT